MVRSDIIKVAIPGDGESADRIQELRKIVEVLENRCEYLQANNVQAEGYKIASEKLEREESALKAEMQLARQGAKCANCGKMPDSDLNRPIEDGVDELKKMLGNQTKETRRRASFACGGRTSGDSRSGAGPRHPGGFLRQNGGSWCACPMGENRTTWGVRGYQCHMRCFCNK